MSGHTIRARARVIYPGISEKMLNDMVFLLKSTSGDMPLVVCNLMIESFLCGFALAHEYHNDSGSVARFRDQPFAMEQFLGAMEKERA